MPKNTAHFSNPRHARRTPHKKNAAPLWASQNFLTSGAEIRRLLALSDIGPSDLVIEIGPGKGHITRELLPRCGKVLAAELDPALYARLEERFAGEKEAGRLALYWGDFLEMPLPKGAYKVFANIPFSRTTDILRRLAYASVPPEAAWLVMELGAAKRFTSGKLAAQCLRPFYQLRIAATIPRTQFHPAPRVDAALLELRRKPQPDLPLSQRQAYRAFLERAWKQGFAGLLTKKQIAAALRTEDLPPMDANLKYVQWLCLFRCWRKTGKK